MNPAPLPTLFVSHGAAVFTTSPSDMTHQWLKAQAERVRQLGPRALVMVSAHDMAWPVRVGAGEAPSTVHDHPVRALYGMRYTAPGSPALARRIQELLKAGGVDSRADAERGLDHGAWVPLSLLAPEARIPVVQVSLDARGAPAAQVALGHALAPLREEGVLLVGSGGVTHDQEEFRRRYFAGVEPYAPPPESHQGFEAWVTEVVVGQRGGARTAALGRFREHPLARHAHPTDEHLLPLLVVVAAAGEAPGRKLFEGRQNGLSTSAFGFGAW